MAKGEFSSYDNMLMETEKQFGSLHTLAISLGKYIQQVTNGGHVQYYHNGYASENSRGCFADYNADLSSHQDHLVEYLENAEDLKLYSWYEELLDIVRSFSIEVDEEREIEEEYYDDDDQEYYTEMVMNPEYGEVQNTYELDKLDDRLYKIDKQVSKDLEEYFKNKLGSVVA